MVVSSYNIFHKSTYTFWYAYCISKNHNHNIMYNLMVKSVLFLKQFRMEILPALLLLAYFIIRYINHFCFQFIFFIFDSHQLLDCIFQFKIYRSITTSCLSSWLSTLTFPDNWTDSLKTSFQFRAIPDFL